jgi:hypothetical protein
MDNIRRIPLFRVCREMDGDLIVPYEQAVTVFEHPLLSLGEYRGPLIDAETVRTRTLYHAFPPDPLDCGVVARDVGIRKHPIAIVGSPNPGRASLRPENESPDVPKPLAVGTENFEYKFHARPD